MSRPKVCFLGNCQAQAFQSLSGHLGLEVDVLLLPPTFKAEDQSKNLFDKTYSEADFIFNQRVDDGFRIEFVRGEYIKSNHPGKSISWPNMYFEGYFPGIKYIYSRSGQKLTGPLSEYHIPEIIDGWKEGRPAEEVAKNIQEGNAFSSQNPAETSILNLMSREAGLDCAISDYIRERFRSRRLFYSMNHPTNEVLAEMLRRLFVAADIKYAPKHSISSYKYTLDQVVLPLYGAFKKKYWPTFKEDGLIKSFVIDASGEQREVTLSLQDATEQFYKLYNSVTYNL